MFTQRETDIILVALRHLQEDDYVDIFYESELWHEHNNSGPPSREEFNWLCEKINVVDTSPAGMLQALKDVEERYGQDAAAALVVGLPRKECVAIQIIRALSLLFSEQLPPQWFSTRSIQAAKYFLWACMHYETGQSTETLDEADKAINDFKNRIEGF